MRRLVTGLGLAAVLLLGPATLAAAQSDAAAQEVESDDDSDKTGLFGLLGLLGLAGLAGLKRRGQVVHDRGTGSTAAGR